MLTTLFQRTFHKYSALPLLGAIANDFDDWLLAQGYAVNSRTHAIEMFPHIDKDLRRRGIEHVTRLTHSTLRLRLESFDSAVCRQGRYGTSFGAVSRDAWLAEWR